MKASAIGAVHPFPFSDYHPVVKTNVCYSCPHLAMIEEEITVFGVKISITLPICEIDGQYLDRDALARENCTK
ncbi:MAG: hypothetical protein ACFFCS_27450 [Candidatus Hodarchaeota archaeon]